VRAGCDAGEDLRRLLLRFGLGAVQCDVASLPITGGVGSDVVFEPPRALAPALQVTFHFGFPFAPRMASSSPSGLNSLRSKGEPGSAQSFQALPSFTCRMGV